MISLIVLLGNPGEQYKRTRHNAAWLFSDYCGWDSAPWQAKWGAFFTDIEVAGNRVQAIKPQKFMNKSGESVAHVARYRRVKPDAIVVVHDDIDLAFGEVEWKRGGGLAGHNGLRSLAERLGSRDFHRLRIGIGRPAHGSVSSYVLSAFSRAERDRLPEIFDRAGALLEARL